MTRAAQIFALATSILACGDVEDTRFRVETLELAAGDYYGLSWGGTQDERFFLVVREGASDGEAVVLSPPGRTPCSLGKIARYTGPMQPRTSGRHVLGSPSPARIQVFDAIDTDGFGTLSFADTSCERTEFTIPDASNRYIWTLYSPDLQTVRLAVLTRDRTLHLVDPWKEESQAVADHVSLLWPVDDGAWLVENGELVKHAFDGRTLARMGENVDEILPLGGDGDIAYVDANGLALVKSHQVKRVASDVCGLHAVDEFRPGALAYYSPCAGNHLVVRAADGKLTHYESDVVELSTQPGRLLFTTDTETGTTLWMVSADHPEKAVVITEQPHFGLQDLWTTHDEKRLAVVAAQDDKTYSLWHIDLTSDAHELTTVRERITVRRSTSKYMATLDSDRLLTLTDPDGAKVLQRIPNAASNFRFVFGASHSALAYLSHYDPDTKLGHLELQFMSGTHLDLGSDVREYLEVWWPERGIVYTVGGERPALRFARIDVPCETSATDYTTWGCGF